MVNLLIVWNVFVCMLYGFDKFAAKNNMRRISEKTLLTVAFLMGGAGAFLGMEIFRHKTKHISFKILVPLFCVINAVIIYFFIRQQG